ncbi:processed acidic surface protein [Metabacillus litoralis]|uniref:processed acidic surface protein n=1 Tax=Metabacillus litoralis TaxID=152268 RepID=UPI000EF5F869|nr:processed acidic surface protein [Metabacillus litoralis]MCM3160115.1 processed acidic surface protein [Metabacillus litoralis]MCM3408699.1 processed acidic surface protein [Metabacillus litoralis]
MKKVMVLFIAWFCLTQQTALAAPPQEDIDQILTELGWTQQDLVDYLDYYELSLDDFETAEDLRSMLGTPITDENLAELLASYEITRQEMDVVLAEFGETLDDYYFIEDLDVALSFYLDHDGEMAEIEEFLALIGLTDEEVDSLFNHFMGLDEEQLEQEMEGIITRLDPYLMMDDMTVLTDAQQNELVSILQDMMNVLQLDARFYLDDNNGVRTEVTFKELMNMEELYGNTLAIELYNTNGDMLLDMSLSEDMLSSEFFIESGIELAEVGDMAGELTNLLHNRLPDTASSLWMNMLLGLLAIGVGITGFFLTKRFQQVK